MSGFWLKIIAIVTMLIDHSTEVLVPKDSPYYLIGRSIGRLAFPIFCFLLVEGFLHTSNVKKYLSRLWIFALISEIPFDLAFKHTPMYLGYQNIYFTLFIGLLVLVALKKIDEKYTVKGSNSFRNAAVVIGGCFLAILLSTDYSFAGVLMILCFYLFRFNKVSLGVSLVIINGIAMGGIQVLAVLALIPIFLYNGKRGPNVNKYLFYAFYPAHIFVLYLIYTFLLK